MKRGSLVPGKLHMSDTMQTRGMPTPRLLDEEVVRAFPGIPGSKIRPAAFASVPYRGIVDRKLVDELTSFLAGYLRESFQLAYSRLTVGLSGGVDSAVYAAL